MTIYFYKVNDKYGFLSNFSKYGFTHERKYWLTSEHFFQSKKFANTSHEEIIRNAKTPMEAAMMGRDKARPLRDDWDNVKDDVMRTAVFLKFQMNEDIRQTLLSTGNEEIIEKTSTDYYWGCGSDGTGINKLGIILMEIREKLR
jgi:ribA/ribD-fused uncharacterized protein